MGICSKNYRNGLFLGWLAMVRLEKPKFSLMLGLGGLDGGIGVFDQRGGVLGVAHLFQAHHVLVAAGSSHAIRLAQAGPQAAGHFLEQLIADIVA